MLSLSRLLPICALVVMLGLAMGAGGQAKAQERQSSISAHVGGGVINLTGFEPNSDLRVHVTTSPEAEQLVFYVRTDNAGNSAFDGESGGVVVSDVLPGAEGTPGWVIVVYDDQTGAELNRHVFETISIESEPTYDGQFATVSGYADPGRVIAVAIPRTGGPAQSEVAGAVVADASGRWEFRFSWVDTGGVAGAIAGVMSGPNWSYATFGPEDAPYANRFTLAGEVPDSGFLLATWNGGFASQLGSALPTARGFFVLVNGDFFTYIPGAPVSVNRSFVALYDRGIPPAGTLFIIRF